MNPSVGVIIGRFQVDEITPGHLELIRAVAEKHPHLCILLGTRTSPAHRDNPLSFTVRKQMLEGTFEDAVVMPLFDRQTDTLWSADVDRLITSAFPGQQAVLYGGRDSFIPSYHGKFPVRELDFGSDSLSGRERRAQIAANHIYSPAFRAGIIHVLHSLPPQVVPCVDIAVIRPASQWLSPSILLGRKSDEVGLRLPGGLVDLEDTSYAAAAARELFEETGLTNEGGLEYVASMPVNDWRCRGRKDIKYFTTLFLMQHHHGIPKAGDDLCDVDWYPLLDAERLIIDFHAPLLATAKAHYLKTKGF